MGCDSYVYIYIYIYIERERVLYTYIYIYIYICTLYTYSGRSRLPHALPQTSKGMRFNELVLAAKFLIMSHD